MRWRDTSGLLFNYRVIVRRCGGWPREKLAMIVTSVFSHSHMITFGVSWGFRW